MDQHQLGCGGPAFPQRHHSPTANSQTSSDDDDEGHVDVEPHTTSTTHSRYPSLHPRTMSPHAHFDTATTPPVEKDGEINFGSSTPNASHEQAIPFSRWVSRLSSY